MILGTTYLSLAADDGEYIRRMLSCLVLVLGIVAEVCTYCGAWFTFTSVQTIACVINKLMVGVRQIVWEGEDFIRS